MNTGIQYQLTGNRERGEVQGYHHKPEPLKLSVSPSKVDVAGLKRRDLINFNLQGAGAESRFTIGFEVEKNQLHRGAVREYELFCGFERDGSCGYEAVTHILPLLPQGVWRTKVYDMMHKASRIIEDSYSPSDHRCGGHSTIAVEGMTGVELNEAVRRYSGIIYALFRNRLKNHYCNYNLRMHSPLEPNLHVNGYHHKYQLALVKGNVLEFRVVSRFESVKQMMRRYELFYNLVDTAVNSPNTTIRQFLTRIKPLLMLMYAGDAVKVDKVCALAVDFQKFIETGAVSEPIRKYLPNR